MSNLMHKVKDAMSGHHGSQHKESSHGSSQMDNKMSDTGAGQGDTYGAPNTGRQDTYGSGNAGRKTKEGSSSSSSSDNERSGKKKSGTKGSRMDTGNTAGAGLSTGAYDTKMGNQMDTSNTGMTGQTGTYTSDYGNTGTTGQTASYGTAGNTTSPAYNTRSANTGSNMGQTESNQRDLSGSAAAGSSYSAPSGGRRRSSGPHSSNLLNKLDPRVKKSDYETAGNQRGEY